MISLSRSCRSNSQGWEAGKGNKHHWPVLDTIGEEAAEENSLPGVTAVGEGQSAGEAAEEQSTWAQAPGQDVHRQSATSWETCTAEAQDGRLD